MQHASVCILWHAVGYGMLQVSCVCTQKTDRHLFSAAGYGVGASYPSGLTPQPQCLESRQLLQHWHVDWAA